MSSLLLRSDETQDVWNYDCLNLSLPSQFSPISSSGSPCIFLGEGNETFATDSSMSGPISDMSVVLSGQLSFGKEVHTNKSCWK